MKSLLRTTALLEGATGLALALVPASVVTILLGTELTEPAAILMGRLAGIALFTIAIACWLSGRYSPSPVIVKAVLVYNVLTIALLVYATLAEDITGPGLFPAVFIHVAMLVWCVSALGKSVQKNT